MSAEDHSSSRVARSAVILSVRRGGFLVLSALSAAVLARELGLEGFGRWSAAFAFFQLLVAATDFGFSLVLGRDLSTEPSRRGRLLSAAVRAQSILALSLAVVLLVAAVASGVHSERGQALAALSPALALSGLVGFRQAFLVLYRTATLGAIDLATNAVAALAVIGVALAGGGVFGVALATSLGWSANTIAVYVTGRRLMPPAPATRDDRRALVRSALPLGAASLLASVYFTIDLVVLGWLVSAHEVGRYAAAVKLLTLLVTVPSLITVAALPGLSARAADRDELSRLAARIWHWLIAAGLPLCVATAIFAGPIVSVAFGPQYASSASVIRVLALAAALALATNVLGTLLTSQGLARPMLVQNTLALALNVGGNVVLAPRYGVIASAWLTVATEALVGLGALWALRGRLSLRPALAVSGRPLAACLALGCVGAALLRWPAIAVPAAALADLAVILALRGWPVELLPGGLRTRWQPREAT
ncbi:MAG: hypothetical protein V7607_739 [Solirubrobacteraceae bacterium]